MVLVATTDPGAAGTRSVAQSATAANRSNGRGDVMKWPSLITGVLAAAVTLAPSAAADRDTDFARDLHTYGIYGQRDYNAWLAKIACKRMDRGVDENAHDAAAFVHTNLDRSTSTEQAWQFLAAGMRTYCPHQLGRLDAAARP
ncbi:putative secreted protein [Mycolicibacterium neoaurum]|uniref:Secreted protein n=2 Tax=Mycolicibacterium neoaurum TaxID=1795 RepID=A0AAV2WQZ5_MYCNE|nr:putative secreted protein [Mycolicibacterium neoaurum]